jgi:hypothetical protein
MKRLFAVLPYVIEQQPASTASLGIHGRIA